MPIEVRLPQLAESMAAGKLNVWLKHEGDQIAAGEAIAEVETDKTNVELEAPGSGVLQRIHVQAGSEVKVGALLAIIGERAEVPAGSDEPASPPTGPESTPKEAKERNAERAEPAGVAKDRAGARSELRVVPTSAPAPATAADTAAARLTATPLAARLAELTGIELSTIPRPSDGGRIRKADVEAVLRQRGVPGYVEIGSVRAAGPAAAPVSPPAPVTSGAFRDEPLSAMRRVSAERLQAAKQTIPHFYLEIDCDVDRLVALREEINANGATAKVTVTDFIVLATARALQKMPAVNAAWVEGAVRLFESVDIAVAVNTPNGLITPVLRGVHRKTLREVSRELRELSERARAGKLKPAEYTGATFTISNLGMFGVTGITPIINPPQAGILGVGAIERRPVARGEEVTIARMMRCTLAADHRALDGAIGAEFLADVRRWLENPVGTLAGE